jgi:uncharacterized repeat protein (TIGR04052 family)
MKNLLIPIACLTLLAACSTPSGPSVGKPLPQPVELKFAAEINGKPFACGQSYPDVGTTKSTLTPSDFRLYISEVALVRADGQAVPVALVQDGVWQLETTALLDFENASAACRNGTPTMNAAVRGTVPAGDYRGVRFTLGVPFARNHGDPTVAPSPLNNTAMFWNWQGGYKFLKFDAASSGRPATLAPPAPAGGGSASGFSVHLGSTVCASAGRTTAPAAPCLNPNRVNVEFRSFDVARNTVVLDIGRVLAGANVDVNAANTSPGCMSFPKDADCPPVMGALGLAYDGVAAPGAQQLFGMR